MCYVTKEIKTDKLLVPKFQGLVINNDFFTLVTSCNIILKSGVKLRPASFNVQILLESFPEGAPEANCTLIR
jgi:hypothetical protein